MLAFDSRDKAIGSLTDLYAPFGNRWGGFVTLSEAAKLLRDGVETVAPSSDGQSALSNGGSSDDGSLEDLCHSPPCLLASPPNVHYTPCDVTKAKSNATDHFTDMFASMCDEDMLASFRSKTMSNGWAAFEDGDETVEPASRRTFAQSSAPSGDGDSMESFSNAPPGFTLTSRVPHSPCNTMKDRGYDGVHEKTSETTTRWEPLPVDGLVDIEPEEGRRRGAEIMEILGVGSDDVKPSVEERKTDVNSKQEADLDHHTMNPLGVAFLARHDRNESTAWPRLVTRKEETHKIPDLGLVSWPANRPSFGDPWCEAFLAAVYEAARYACGSYFMELVTGVDGAIAVRLQGSSDEWDAWTVLDSLGHALRPLLGSQLVALNRNVKSSRVRLTVQLLCEDAWQRSKYCWEFTTRGTCARGAQCRWSHAPQETCLFDIEITH